MKLFDWCESRHKTKYLSTFNFYHLGRLGRTSNSCIFCNAGEVLESTRYGGGPFELISMDWQVVSNGETPPELPFHSTVHVYGTTRQAGECTQYVRKDNVRSADTDIPWINYERWESSLEYLNIKFPALSLTEYLQLSR